MLRQQQLGSLRGGLLLLPCASRGQPQCQRQRVVLARNAASLALGLTQLHSSQMPVELARRAITAALDQPISIASTSIIQSAPNGATVWFTTVCALSVMLAALLYNLISILAQVHLIDTRKEEKREVLHGVDVTNSRFFRDDRVLAAVEFAAQAHAGQVRKTGEPYINHCLEAALIVEHNLPPAAQEQDRYARAVTAAVLHDVIDDTSTDISTIKAKFGSQVASMVSCVSKLSNMNQLLRRGKRKGWAEYGPQDFKALRKMIVDMVFEEPLVILIKLSDRLHNMRTVWVLKPEKQRAVAEETLEVWCTMAECLGWDGLKSEMEDLCFAVLHPKEYCTLRAQLDRIWSLPSLKVVVEQADSSSLPANALAPAPPLTSRGRRAAAATAARKAAAAAKSAMAALKSSPEEDETQPAKAPAAPAPSNPVLPFFPFFAKLMPPRQAGQAPAGRGPSITPGQQTSQAATAHAGKGRQPFPPGSQGLDLGIRIVSSGSESGSNGAGSSRDGGEWDLGTWQLDEGGQVHAGPGPHAGPGQLPSGNQGQGQGERYSNHPHDVHQLTAASVARFVAADSCQLLQQTSQELQGETYSLLSSKDRKLLQQQMQKLAGAGRHAVSLADSHNGNGDHGTARGPTLVQHQHSPASSSAGLGGASRLPWRSSSSGAAAAVAVGSTATATVVAPSPVAASSGLVSPAASNTAVAVLEPPPAPPRLDPELRPKPAITTLLSADELEQALSAPPRASPPREVPAEVESLPPILYTQQQLQLGLPSLPGGSKAEIREQQERLRSLLSTVVPFDSVNFKDTRQLAMSTRRGLEVLDQCAEVLYSEVMLRSSGGGLSLQIQGRLKSLHSVYKKMVRKGCSVAEVYDARALRVIVGDEGGSRMRDAIETCYKLVSTVHSIWKPIPHEFDDYIANPKPSGYQALHTAVKGPGGIPMEVQIKTSSMHELAEYGAAAHWVYKEYAHSSFPLPMTPMTSMTSAMTASKVAAAAAVAAVDSMPAGAGGAAASAGASLPVAVQSKPLPAAPASYPVALPVRLKGRGWAGQPVLRIAKDKLRYGVVVFAENEGKKLLVAVRAGPTSNQYPIRMSEYGFYQALMEYVLAKGWTVPGHSDFNVRLEEFVLANDGRFHRKDHMGYVQPGEVLTLLEGYEEEADAALRLALASQAAAAAAAAQDGASAAAAQPEAQSQVMRADSAQQVVAHAGLVPGAEPPAAQPSIAQAVAAYPGQQQEEVQGSQPMDHAGRQEAQQSDPVADRLRRQMQEAYLRTQQLRTMIEWGRAAMGRYHQRGSEPGDEVSVLVWPGGTIEHWPRGTTVGQVVRAKGIITLAPRPEPPDIRPSATAIAGGDDGWLAIQQQDALRDAPQPVVNVNNRLVTEDTVLNDGDLVILAREKVKI